MRDFLDTSVLSKLFSTISSLEKKVHDVGHVSAYGKGEAERRFKKLQMKPSIWQELKQNSKGAWVLDGPKAPLKELRASAPSPLTEPDDLEHVDGLLDELDERAESKRASIVDPDKVKNAWKYTPSKFKEAIWDGKVEGLKQSYQRLPKVSREDPGKHGHVNLVYFDTLLNGSNVVWMSFQ